MSFACIHCGDWLPSPEDYVRYRSRMSTEHTCHCGKTQTKAPAPAPDPAERDAKLLRFTLLALACQGMTHVAFHNAFDNDFPRVVKVQGNMSAELRALAQELWPT